MAFKKGHIVPEEWRIKIGNSRRGLPGWSAGKKRLEITGENSKLWKDDEVGYRAIHIWVQSRLGKAVRCSKCGSKGGQIRGCHWSNISGEYKRDLSDWKSLCPKCNFANGVKIHKRFKQERRTNLLNSFNVLIMDQS